MEKAKALVQGIINERQFQKKYLQDIILRISLDEKSSLEQLVCFYESQGFSINEQVQAYLLFLDDTIEESKYFVENGRYRYSKFNEVAENVYFNQDYMTKYMLGLALSTYLWEQHLDVLRWFKLQITSCKCESYLEIGPGHGEYFLIALENTDMKKYTAIDISETSIDLTKKYVSFMRACKNKSCEFLCEDFLIFKSRTPFDMIVMGEVLEHVEEPVDFLTKIRQLFSGNGKILITVPVNAPAKDHIYLFKSMEEVFDKVRLAGLAVEEYQCFTANGRELKKAVKYKEAILIALVLK